ncbi:Cell surface Cu-only superoxide dismutase 5 [Spathaspora sp. JA1]|nr:Cell surface Cu-only superoxide dismutase 5 [Spathaspora sp. JA1]
MVSKTSIALLAATALAQNAPVSTDSPQGVTYVAKFVPNSHSNISGTVEFEAAKNGSVLVNVDVNGLPSQGGPFPYHIHEKPVPSDGNCTGTLGHLNPFNGSMTSTVAAGKEAGDLAGKHGNITASPFQTSYVDNYISLNPSNPAYIGGLSVVIHANDNSRLTCANITEEAVVNKSNGTTSVASANGAGNLVANGLVAGGLAGAVAWLI